jgi:hypothetical protein
MGRACGARAADRAFIRARAPRRSRAVLIRHWDSSTHGAIGDCRKAAIRSRAGSCFRRLLPSLCQRGVSCDCGPVIAASAQYADRRSLPLAVNRPRAGRASSVDPVVPGPRATVRLSSILFCVARRGFTAAAATSPLAGSSSCRFAVGADRCFASDIGSPWPRSWRSAA